MKLRAVERGDSVVSRIKLRVMRLVFGQRPPDVVRVLMYRKALFGGPTNRYFQHLLRGPSPWTVGERELIAAVTSKANECTFCYGAHRAVAARALEPGVVDAVFMDPDTAPVSAALRATLPLIHKLTRTPYDVSKADVETLRAAGVSQRALEDAIHICTVFSIINRLANALDFEIPTPDDFDRGAKFLLKHGYDL